MVAPSPITALVAAARTVKPPPTRGDIPAPRTPHFSPFPRRRVTRPEPARPT